VEHLLDFFDKYVRGKSEMLVYDDGFRRWSYTANQVRAAAESFAGQLLDAGLRPADRFALWIEDRPEWVMAFWGCMLCGVAVIPIDPRASADLLRRILTVATPRGILIGNNVHSSDLPTTVRVWRLKEIDTTGAGSRVARAATTPDVVAEIVFTSGTTGDPKGVVITHRNIVANITPIESEALKFNPYLWPLHPLRFLNLLPLSHMFGQALAIFLPPLVSATAIFAKGYNPDDIVAQIRRYRITLAVTVPRVMEILRNRVQRLAPRCANPQPARRWLPGRLWRYRQAHRLFGWKFCGFVVGGASLDQDLETFWRRLGFAVIQGYGLTEAAPIVAWNHPFKQKHGTVGAPLQGVDVRIASDGEILVRGPIVTSGYFAAPGQTWPALEDGWLHTGDLGSFDDSGHLRIRGRKKDVIVTPEGLHVFPEDVERIVERIAGVREAAIVGRRLGQAERVHAVLVLGPDADPDTIIGEANARLESHQRIREFSRWPFEALPRTVAIRKLKRYEIREWVEQHAAHHPETTQPAADAVERAVAKYVDNRRVGPDVTLDELGLTSLDRIELAIALEEQARAPLSEAAVGAARTVGDLRRVVEKAEESGAVPELFSFPSWSHGRLASTARNAGQTACILPLAKIFLRLRVNGLEHLDALEGPILLAANHQSHFDTPAILIALPRRWRRVMAVSMAKEYFDAHFFPQRHSLIERMASSTSYYLAVLFFNAFPLPRTEPGARETLRYMGELVSDGCSIVIFPEGHRTERGEISPFRPGVAMIGTKLRLPVVPVRLAGVERVLHKTWYWPRRGTVSVSFGAPLLLDGENYSALARQIEQAVVALQPSQRPP
jgi:long-chain acyl-CoA synthetase